MKRITIAFLSVLALAACGSEDQARESAEKAKEATQVTVDSAQQNPKSAGQPNGQDTQATVDSADQREQDKAVP